MGEHSGEEIFASKFILLDSVPNNIRPDFKESLYKTSFNLGDAHLYLSLLNLLDKQDRDAENIGVLFIMAAISFSVSLRKVTDRLSKCNIRYLITHSYSNADLRKKLEPVEKIYASYSPFIDQVIVHQDKGKIKEAPQVPGWEQNKKDLEFLTDLFNEIAAVTCSRYLKPKTEHSREVSEFKKMIAVDNIES